MMDTATLYLHKAIDFCLLKQPKRTALGILLGAFLDILKKVFSPFLTSFQSIDILSISFIESIVIGIFIVNIKQLYHAIKDEPSKFSEDIEEVLASLNYAKENGNLSASEMRSQYRKLLEIVLLKYQETSSLPTTENKEEQIQ